MFYILNSYLLFAQQIHGTTISVIDYVRLQLLGDLGNANMLQSSSCHGNVMLCHVMSWGYHGML